MLSIPRLTPVVRVGVVVLIVSYVALLVATNWLGFDDLPMLLALDLSTGLRPENGWQVVTYLLAQGTGPMSVPMVLIGVLFFWLMVAPFEERFGAKRTLQLLALSTFAGSLPALAVGMFLHGYLAGFSPLLLGALAAGAWVAKISNAQVSFFGVVPMTPVQMILVVLFFSLLIFLASRNFIELTADLGATAGGILFVESLCRPPQESGTRRKRAAQKRSTAPLKVIEGGQRKDPPKWLN